MKQTCLKNVEIMDWFIMWENCLKAMKNY